MQPFDFLCTHCHGTLRVSIPELIGRKVRCPHCRQPILVQQPETTGFAWGEQTVEGQIGSGLRLASGSGLALADDDDHNHVWGDDYTTDDSVLGGESADSWRDRDALDQDALDSVEEAEAAEDPSSTEDEVVDLLESAAIDTVTAPEPAHEGEAAEATVEEPAAAVEEPAEDDAPSVEIESPRASSRSYGAPTARTASAPRTKTTLPNPLLLMGGAVGAILIVVALVIGMSGGRSSAGARSKGYGNSKVQRRNPKEFQDFARDAAKRGWR